MDHLNISQYLLPLYICLLFCTDVNAQNNNRSVEDRIEAQRIAFITEFVDLTAEEAQAFWPIFNAFRKDEKALKAEKEPAKSPIDMSDQEAHDHIQHLLSIERKLLDRRELFVEQLQDVLSSRKIMRLFRAEKKFKERLLRAINQRRNR
ncbi:MAG: hypothetical protein HKN87_23985 [Saprospiraceae bacterium]|nr:hypothetical protein [Saprospiraceae bacterium]